MSKIPESIAKQPVLKPAEDYYRLRREGIGFIEKLGSHQWTDYNTHDPGITILEALCYAITDFAYRTGWDIKDLLAPATPSTEPNQPFPNQAFFTAREILTVNPVTSDDFRRLLIDLIGVRNAWVLPKKSVSDLYSYWCEEEQLRLSYLEPQGLYEILLELESDPELGDLNAQTVEKTFSIVDEETELAHPLTLEVNFQSNLLNDFPGVSINTINLTRFVRDKDQFHYFINENELKKGWRNVFYISFEIGETHLNASVRLFGNEITLKHLLVKTDTTKNPPYCLQNYLEDNSVSGFIQLYLNKLLKAKQAIAEAKLTLNSYRNLSEDYYRIIVIQVERVAVCADVEVKPDADIERVQAKIWFEIDQYFNPPISFYSLQEMMAADVPVEDIFNGPALNNGFIKTEELQNTGLKTVLRTSDIINRLMNIEGVAAINNLLLSKYDTEGNIMKRAADPERDGPSGKFFFKNPEKTSAEWSLIISDLHQPRLSRNMSRFLFFKNGLPYTARKDEASDTLMQLRGEAERQKMKNAQKDLPIPSGTFRQPEEYYPLQYSFPLTYGIGPEGLPSHVSPQRRAQAKQLKAYLMVFEQLLGNALAQLAHSADLFSLDASIDRTYFVREFSETVIQGYTGLIKGLDKAELESITETAPEFHERRNRFLNHLMARFGEQFNEYALLLTNFQGWQVALDRLIEDKIAFLKAYPLISHDRGKAFNYKDNPCSPDNFPGIKKRASLLLGYPDLGFFWTLSPDAKTITHYQLEERNKISFIITEHSLSGLTKASFPQAALQKLEGIKNQEFLSQEQFISELKKQLGTDLVSKCETLLLQHGKNKKAIWREGDLNIPAADKLNAYHEIIVQMNQPRQAEAYEIIEKEGQFYLARKDKDKAQQEQYPKPYKTKAEADALYDELAGWSANERVIVVEHLLLRPKFPGDAFYPVCADDSFSPCGDEDPYSFRLTFVMPGWTTPYNTNLEMRRFADRTIRQETPAHLLAKICWVDNTGFEQFERFEEVWRQWLEANANIDWTEARLQERVLALLKADLDPTKPSPSSEHLCQCAAKIIGDYAAIYYEWMQTNISKGESWQNFGELPQPNIADCDLELLPEATTKQNITELFIGRKVNGELLPGLYSGWVEVSYHLWILVNLLSQLHNTYPGATLHDCDDGSDQNPVRLDNTALGNYPLRSSAT